MTRTPAKRLSVLGLLILVLSQACPASPTPGGAEVEQIVELEFGFKLVTLKMPSDFEIGRHTYLFCRDEKICKLGIFSLSPSGSYVVFQDGRSGNVYLYRCADRRRVQLTRFTESLPTKSVPVVVKFVWHEEDGTVDWYYAVQSIHFNVAINREPVGVDSVPELEDSGWFSAPIP